MKYLSGLFSNLLLSWRNAVLQASIIIDLGAPGFEVNSFSKSSSARCFTPLPGMGKLNAQKIEYKIW